MRSCSAITAVVLFAAVFYGPLPAAAGDPAGDATIAAFVAAQRALGKTPNHLIHESSPYLLLHAFNPVNWYPWGDAAFEKARREDKPIFLSIGYMTCHWCHVMARESFSDPQIAALLNRYFVSIKVDREERPDIDRIYMAATQALTGSGGWPMTVFLTPARRPFYAGTYFPPQARDNLPGLADVLRAVHRSWMDNRGRITASAKKITALLKRENQFAARSAVPAQTLLAKAYRQFAAHYDRQYAGFGHSAKFPRPVVFNFLLRWYARGGQKDALDMTLATLRRMAAGGIHDVIGGGFHRYAVDRRWRVPHFEKMLYDQAQLAVSYLEAYQISSDAFFARIARGIFAYVLRDLTGPGGQFYSAQDADSPLPDDPRREGEGAYYLWTYGEIEKALGKHDAAIFGFRFGIRRKGNAPADPKGAFKGQNILYQARSTTRTAERFGIAPQTVRRIIKHGRQKLSALRAKRPPPRLDDKTLTGENGLMISALARGFQVLDEPRYLYAATRAANFILDNLYDRSSGRLLRRYRRGKGGIDGHLEDYAFLVQGLLDLYESTFDIAWLKHAGKLTEHLIAHFWDTGGGFFETAGTDTALLMRMKADYDGPEPSGNSVAALNLLRLAQMIGRGKWRDRAAKILSVFGPHLQQYPAAMPQMLVALDLYRSRPRQIVVAGRPDDPRTHRMLRFIYARFVPDRTLLLADGGAAQRQLAANLPFVAALHMVGGRPTAYVCRNHVCRLPTSDLKVLARLLTIPIRKGSGT